MVLNRSIENMQDLHCIPELLVFTNICENDVLLMLLSYYFTVIHCVLTALQQNSNVKKIFF